MALMREGFKHTRRAPHVVQLEGELAAIDTAIRSLRAGDILLCQVDQVEVGLDFVKALLPRLESAPQPSVDETRSALSGWVPRRISAVL
jgi:molybdopterin-guanine dinucleotide biosynthesis protein A